MNEGQELRREELEGEGKLFPAGIMLQKGLRPQEQANLAWSLTVFENYDDHVVSLLQNVFHAATSSAAGEDDGGLIQLEHAHQLWQAYSLLREDRPATVGRVPAASARFLEEKWDAEKGRGKRSSRRHAVVSETLDLMRVAHRNEHDECIDVAIVLEEGGAWTCEAVDLKGAVPREPRPAAPLERRRRSCRRRERAAADRVSRSPTGGCARCRILTE